MSIEEIIMVVFVTIIFTAVPAIIWYINVDTKRLEREEKERKEQLRKQQTK